MNMEDILSKIPDKTVKRDNGDRVYVKTKIYFPLFVGEQIGRDIQELKDLCRKGGKRVPNDTQCLKLLKPEVAKDIDNTLKQIEKIERALSE